MPYPHAWVNDSIVQPVNATALEEIEAQIDTKADAAATTAALAAKLGLAGGTMTGPLTLSADPTNALHAATRQWVLAQITALVGGAPGALDTLKELADAIADDANYATTITTALAGKVPNSDIRLATSLGIALGDESTALTTGTAKVTFRMPHAMTLSGVRANVNTVSSSGLPTFDIKHNGTSIFSTLLSIDASEKTSVTAATPAVLSTTNLLDDAEMTVDITVAGTGAKGAKIWLLGTKTS